MIAAYPWTIRKRFTGRLPYRVAYPLILIAAVILWSAIGIAIFL